MRDLIQDLIDGRVTAEQAEDVCSEALANASEAVSAPEALGISKKEWTAYAHGAEFQDLANWRAHGWPDRCFVCGQPISLDDFGWLAREHDGRMQLKHVVCKKVN